MARLDADELHSVTTENGRYVVKVTSGKALYEMSIDPVAGALLAEALKNQAISLPAEGTRKMIINTTFQGIRTDQGALGLVIEFSPHLEIPLLLGRDGLARLRDTIDELLK
jgi:hypothetical protein